MTRQNGKAASPQPIWYSIPVHDFNLIFVTSLAYDHMSCAIGEGSSSSFGVEIDVSRARLRMLNPLALFDMSIGKAQTIFPGLFSKEEKDAVHSSPVLNSFSDWEFQQS